MSKLSTIIEWSKEGLTTLTRQDFITGKYQDDAFLSGKEKPVDTSLRSSYLNTPIGDRYIGFRYKTNVTLDSGLPNVTATPIYNPLNNPFIVSPEYTGQGLNNNNTFLMIEDPIITISRTKEIIQTSVNGLDGKIIEVDNNGNFDINILCTFSGETFWVYDDFKLKILNNISLRKSDIEITSPFLNDIFNINNVFITDYKVGQSTEFTNITAIEINCVSVLEENIFKIDELL